MQFNKLKLNKFIEMRNAKRAFTLVEILMVVFVSALLFIVLINFFKDNLSKFMTAEQQGDNLRDTRLLLINFERDIREATELLNFEDNALYTNIQIKRYKFENKKKEIREPEYVIYTLYKSKQTISGVELPFSLCKNVLKDAPPQLSDVAITPYIKGVEKNLKQVGIIPKAKDSSNREVQTEIGAYNMHYDPSYLNIPFLSFSDKEKERARSRFLGKYNGALLGFNEKKRIVAIELTFITNDDRNVINVYRSFIYLRKSFYDKLTDGDN
ncbi:MAG TPA: prepilin-type N-terminal cleavage/methylation domain-containing protein [Candidatus Wallbacteria bacterium]|nr:prepilin-type N-terminal cleavage/methylation domain-containing protein [Candidatus Wallbacteria bacterium]